MKENKKTHSLLHTEEDSAVLLHAREVIEVWKQIKVLVERFRELGQKIEIKADYVPLELSKRESNSDLAYTQFSSEENDSDSPKVAT